MKKKAATAQNKYDELVLARGKEKRMHEGSDERYKKLEQKYSALEEDMQVLTLKLEEDKASDAFDIRHTKLRSVLSLTLNSNPNPKPNPNPWPTISSRYCCPIVTEPLP